MARQSASPPTHKTINLALQGGGAHGAFAWGVLDYLLEDGRLSFEGISGTSAGSMNAVVLVDGLLKGGHAGAREGGGHYRLTIVSPQFVDKSTVARHRMIYSALKDMMQRDIHALNITAIAPHEPH